MSSRFGPEALSLHVPAETVERIIRFLKTHTERVGARNLIVGMSGGLDSSVTAVLCSMAVGGRRTIGLSLPEGILGVSRIYETPKNSRKIVESSTGRSTSLHWSKLANIWSAPRNTRARLPWET